MTMRPIQPEFRPDPRLLVVVKQLAAKTKPVEVERQREPEVYRHLWSEQLRRQRERKN